MQRVHPFLRRLNHHYRPATSSLSGAGVPSSLKSVSSLFTSAAAPIPPPKRPLRLFSRFLKFGSLSALAATGYVTYAYTGVELAQKTSAFRESYMNMSDHPPTEGSSSTEGYVVEERNAKTKSFKEGTGRDEDSGILESYVSSFISNAKSVTAKTIDIYLTVRFLIEDIIMVDFKPPSDKLLPDMNPGLENAGVYTLVLDLNETLVPSRWKRELPTVGQNINIKRPELDAFLEYLRGTSYEVVLFTDELSFFVFILLSSLEIIDDFHHLLTRGFTKYQDGKRYRDLSKLNRDPSKIVYVSGNALENCLQPENCVPIKPWRKEVDDTTLSDLLPFLEYVDNERPDDIRPILATFKGGDIATLSKYHKRRMLELEEKRKSEEREMVKWKMMLERQDVDEGKRILPEIGKGWLQRRMLEARRKF